ncbi:ubiE/COQ5 methyltransferase family protein [Sulfobacillus thermosulfidooxidans DSM 9293]|uniref:UbiE/COQ5 methyltransferase family protein n=1 Tax=Sulfobacillus thermosulfidooxidans (strain DSM 9293 / VKM B-1269 / AT-1) TaxID=929705 RepID=A0A1W1WJ47_SULTA|nr:class I SAM-dependent methyltransferase [Sulfobacillus thermosulfidooxidans]SMC06276.1 ubiE/COQ5 methyltransferase family protein [Sulfobacillus thermosulfidooxidans DSM 9293]
MQSVAKTHTSTRHHSSRRSSHVWPWHEWALEHMEPAKAASILDLGCGKGHMARSLITEMGPYGEIVAVDPSPELLHEAENRSQSDIERRIQWMMGTHHHVFYPDNSFDRILTEFILDAYYADDILQEVQRLICDRGRVVFLCYGTPTNHLARFAQHLWHWIVSYHRFVGLPSRNFLNNPIDIQQLAVLLPSYNFQVISSQQWLGGFIYGLTVEYHEANNAIKSDQDPTLIR